MTPRKKREDATELAHEDAAPTSEKSDGFVTGEMGVNLASLEGFSTLSDEAREVLRARAASLATESVSAVEHEVTPILVFYLADEVYAVRVDEVREIHNEYLVTPVPCTPDYIKGVLNIRGEIISVMDVKRLLRIDGEYEGADYPIIIVRIGSVSSALLVDAIGDIAEADHAEVAPPLATIEKYRAELLTGSIHVKGKAIALMNLAKVLEPIGGAA